MFLAFAPFIAFAVLNHFVAPTAALVVAALVSFGLIGRDVFVGRSPKILEVGTCVLFGGLALYAYLSHASWPVVGVKLAVDIGLLVIILFSLMVGRPFTIQYARENVPKELWDNPQFLRTNQIITLVWLAAFAAIIAADLILLYMPEVPHKVGVLLTIGALYGAFKFTMAYPDKGRAKAG
jgi:signal transduction histidine kinase